MEYHDQGIIKKENGIDTDHGQHQNFEGEYVVGFRGRGVGSGIGWKSN